MREIKFRGKRLDNGEWVYGSLIKMDEDGSQSFIFPYHKSASSLSCGQLVAWNMVAVDIETVGQYTGIKDRNGVEIYEGDILEFEDVGEEGYEYVEGYDFTNRAKVVYRNARFELEAIRESESAVFEDMRHCHDDFVRTFKISKVIGNIHDNPELLEGAR